MHRLTTTAGVLKGILRCDPFVRFLKLIFSDTCSLLRWYGEQLLCYMEKAGRLQEMQVIVKTQVSKILLFWTGFLINQAFFSCHVSYPKCTGVEDEQQQEYQNLGVRYLQTFWDCSWSWKHRTQRNLLQRILLPTPAAPWMLYLLATCSTLSCDDYAASCNSICTFPSL